MSKKATRRAAREAFPKAKNPSVRRSRFDPPQKSSAAKRKSSGSAHRPGTPRPPSIKRAAISAFIMAVLYFLMIQYAFKSGAAIGYNMLMAFIGFIIFAVVVWATDNFRYRRYLKKKSQTK